MNHPSLPFTLHPLPGESFDSWLVAYAARLHTSTGDMAAALGLPRTYLDTSRRALLTNGLSKQELARVVTATG